MVWNNWMEPFVWSPLVNPWSGLERFDARARLYRALEPGAEVPVRVHAKEDALLVLALLPGRDPSDVEVSVSGRKLLLRGKGEKQAEAGDGATRYARQGFALTEFERSFELPWDVDADGVRATFANGVLRIELARVAQERPRRITIEQG